MASKCLYRQLELDPATDCIRLAQIVYSYQQNGCYISLKLQRFSLSSCPSYHAVSYEWGPPSPVKAIFVNGEQFSVQMNLWYFLWQAKIPEECQWLWIDALCIDQGNSKEKNHQVGMMRKIYSNASSVLVWLGVTADDSDYVMHLIESAGPGLYPIIQDHLQWYSGIRFHKLDRTRFSPGCIDICSSIFRFFERSYWKRMWIIQELCLAKDCRFLCGTEMVEHLSLINFYVNSLNLRENDFLTPVLRFAQRPMTGKIPIYNLRELLIETKPQRCTDKHDRIYALFGLLEDDSHGIPIDYDCTMVELYTRVLETMFLQEYDYLPMELHLLRRSLSVSETDESAQLETYAYLSSYQRLGFIKEPRTRLMVADEEAWAAGTASGREFRRHLLQASRQKADYLHWAGEEIALEPYVAGTEFFFLWPEFPDILSS